MAKYKVRFDKENWKAYYKTEVEAAFEQEAFIKARDEAENKGIKLPDEVWTSIKIIK